VCVRESVCVCVC